ncbi:unnamed protein product [Protopolystoma xenopodis]|uniref:Uncharacterized protein n=1 Tax=Protopolystoma xenopodis TaxID=117903 RepID=A0A3S5FEZ8_9PLAT|nr:unnamed protein product [Protopolystoma xenopodis]
MDSITGLSTNDTIVTETDYTSIKRATCDAAATSAAGEESEDEEERKIRLRPMPASRKRALLERFQREKQKRRKTTGSSDDPGSAGDVTNGEHHMGPDAGIIEDTDPQNPVESGQFYQIS